ncbi:hypothetical protein FHS59_000886 [Algoriphagus iocasae]|uniref:Uncharacterized protein n=1 Tax=Algoriphagus iocasae TaxID=1836499 RepID=A0A841MTE1_9BACT|nr:hypothetical protein [Algoriphagus iocasae]MBB6325271.1 hypothetical protein [Algoriphagus iocasae]
MTTTELHNRYFIADQKLIDQLESQFDQVDQNETEWTITYMDKETGDKWLSYRVDSEYHGGGNPVMCRLPIPDTNKLIDIALQTENEDEVFAACRTLVNYEQLKNIDFRSDLINRLEDLKNKERRKRIIELTGLDSPINRREIVGKTSDQVDKDSKHFQGIARRAMKLTK